MNAIELLKADHALVQDLCQQCREAMATDPEVCRELFEKIRDELELHSDVEERIFYPAVANAGSPELRNLIDEAMDDHLIVKELLGEITESLQDNSEQLANRLTLLFENVTRHVREEEEAIFPLLDGALGTDTLEELGAQMEGMKGPVMAADAARGYVPGTPHAP